MILTIVVYAVIACVVFSGGFVTGAAYNVRARSDFIHSLMAEEAAAAERDLVHEAYNG